MTSSRRYGPSVQNQFNLAGRRLGLDLAGLFEENEDGSTQFGDLVPGMRVTSTGRGRGHGLTMKPQQRDAVTTEFSLTPEAKGASSSSSSSVTLPGGPPQEVEKEPEIELKQYFGNVGGVGLEDIGEKGFGMKDYNAAVAAGYDPDSIREYVMANKENLYNIGPDAQRKLGITGYVSTKPGVFDYSQYGGTGFGMEDVKALEAQGVSEADMMRLAQQAPNVGPDAAARFGIAQPAAAAPAAPSYSRPTGAGTTPVTGYGLGKGDGSGFNYGAFGGSGFGMKDVAALASKGASQADMKRIAQGASNIGPEARKLLGL